MRATASVVLSYFCVLLGYVASRRE
jgi:hypothetical protein